jgi:trehalose/maltose hydrolase-like predicted phosphorylase
MQQIYNASDVLDTNSISVGGLGSDSYAGFIFWDAEVWMGPGLVVSHPDAAKQIAAYRAKLLPQAEQNVMMAFTSSQNETGKFTGGAVYPWTSGRFGNCTGTGPCFDYEYHINGDIGLELFNYLVASGDTAYFNSSLFPVYDGIAYFYSELLTFNSSSGQYTLTNATDPVSTRLIFAPEWQLT